MNIEETLRMQSVQTSAVDPRDEEHRAWTEQDRPPMDVMQAVALRNYLEEVRTYQKNGACSLSHRAHLKDERKNLYERGIIREDDNASVVESVVERLNQLVEQYADIACSNDATYGYGLLARVPKGHKTSMADPLKMEARDLMRLAEKNYPKAKKQVAETIRKDRFGFLRKARETYKAK